MSPIGTVGKTLSLTDVHSRDIRRKREAQRLQNTCILVFSEGVNFKIEKVQLHSDITAKFSHDNLSP